VASPHGSVRHGAVRPLRSDDVPMTFSTTTSTTAPPATAPVAAHTPAVDVHTTGTNVVPPASTTNTTSGPPPTTTTTTATPAALPADRTQTDGYLDPPLQNSGVFAVAGSGPTEVSVVWSTPVYLSMTVTCPGGSQTVSGTTAMATSLPDASGCQATVSEPPSESSSLTYTVTMGPVGG
jgi:hypothetical protein